MSKATLKSAQAQMRGDRRQKREVFPDIDRDKAEGQIEDLYRFLEERYGYSRDKAKEELHRRIRR